MAEETTPKNEVSKAVNIVLSALLDVQVHAEEYADDLESSDLERIKATLEVEIDQIFIQIAAAREITYSNGQMTDRPFTL